jgi:hypothetical protein
VFPLGAVSLHRGNVRQHLVDPCQCKHCRLHLALLTLQPCRRWRCVTPKHWASSELQGITIRTTFTVTAVRTSYQTFRDSQKPRMCKLLSVMETPVGWRCRSDTPVSATLGWFARNLPVFGKRGEYKNFPGRGRYVGVGKTLNNSFSCPLTLLKTVTQNEKVKFEALLSKGYLIRQHIVTWLSDYRRGLDW